MDNATQANVAKTVAPILARTVNDQLNPPDGTAPDFEGALEITKQLSTYLRTATGQKITRTRSTTAPATT